MAYAAISISDFPIAAWMRKQAVSTPGLADNALAVIEGKAPLQRIVSINRHARSQGLGIGMSKVQAETTGPVNYHERSIQEEQDAIDEVHRIAQRFSPRVQIIAAPANRYAGSATMAASLLLDQNGTTTVFGTARQYAAKLKNALRTGGFDAHIALTPNAEASLMLAQSHNGVICVGVICVDEYQLAERLAPLPVSLLPCEASTLNIFARWGIRTLGELAALPTEALISRIGQQAHRLQQLAKGTADHLLSPQAEAFVLEEKTDLDNPLDQLESLLFVVSPMLDRLLRKAIEHAFALRTLALTLTLEKAAPYQLQIRPALPTQTRDLLLKLLNLELQAHPPAAAILAVQLVAEPAKPHTAQRGLFQAQFPEPDKLDLLLARLRSIAGNGNVGSPQLRNSHRDDEYSIESFRPRIFHNRYDYRPPSPRIALRRLRPPQTARVQFSTLTPIRLFWQGQRYDIIAAKGPWESSGYWWDGRLWAAEEWDAVIAAPVQAIRLRHELEPDDWTIAGIYD